MTNMERVYTQSEVDAMIEDLKEIAEDEIERLKKHGLKNIFAGTAIGAGVGIAFTSLVFLLFGAR